MFSRRPPLTEPTKGYRGARAAVSVARNVVDNDTQSAINFIKRFTLFDQVPVDHGLDPEGF